MTHFSVTHISIYTTTGEIILNSDPTKIYANLH